jgi:hypothetical protein
MLNEGDRIQTKDGLAEITFEDGSVLKMSPFTSVMIQEREEERGWLLKTRSTVRRVSVFVGKLWFSSGTSHRTNILQTPTAVCGLRGSVAEIGYDNVSSFLNVISGGSDTIGAFMKGFFENPGVDAALKNLAYQSLVAAGQVYGQAEQTGAALDKLKAELKGLEALKAAAEALRGSPDRTVADWAEETLKQVNARIEQKNKEVEELLRMTGESTTVREMTTTVSPPTFPLTTVTNPVTTTTRGSATTTTLGEPLSPSGSK